MATYRLMDGVSGRPGNGPSAVDADTGPFARSFMFTVTANDIWFQGFWLWVAANGDTVAQKCCLWQLTDTSHGNSQTLVPNSTVTSGTLTVSSWNFVALATPIALSASCAYVACSGWTMSAGFVDTQNYFGSGDPYAGGITNGPLQGYSSFNGTLPEPYSSNYEQGLFGTSSADPTVSFPATPDLHSNFWIDLQVTDKAPAGASYQLWPSQPTPINWTADTATNFTLGTEFSLSQSCTLNAIWFYSQPGVTQLPTACGIWTTTGNTLVAQNLSPTWSGAAGSGWVSCTFTGVTLPAGQYKTTVFNGAVTPAIWNCSTALYWSTGPGGSGITNGPLSAPNNASATSPGQSSYHQSATFTFPDTNVGPYNYWVDVQVTPAASPSSTVYPCTFDVSGVASAAVDPTQGPALGTEYVRTIGGS